MHEVKNCWCASCLGLPIWCAYKIHPSPNLMFCTFNFRFWRLSLPIGNTADHPFANPIGAGSPDLESVTLDPILAVAGGNELLKDRVEGYATRLKEVGKRVEYVEFEGEHHGFFVNHPYSQASNTLLKLIQNFMSKLL